MTQQLKICSIKKIGPRHVYDIETKQHHNFIANNVVVHNCTSHGAQRLFMKAKPTSIIDIAALTSIYRPGPLAANVDKLYLDAKNNDAHYDWGDQRINGFLKETYELLIFQEGVMMLAEKVAGFPKDKCDEVRRAIMKRSISGGDAAKAKVDQMKNDFVDGSVKNGYDKKVAEDLYEKIAYFSGYAFNKSHATAYAIDSYYCAWLLTHYEEEWLTAYLESMSNNPDDRARAFGEVKRLGYQIVPIDINHATSGWTVLPGKKFMPSLSSCKGVGDAAIEEIVQNRPFSSIEDLLWNEDGTWKPSKLNKRALESLIKVGALGSLDLVGEDRMFATNKQLHYVVIENNDVIKKTSKKDPHIGRKNFFELIKETKDLEEWTKLESAKNMVDVFGTLDVTAMIDQQILDKFIEKGIKPIDAFEENEKNIAWFVITNQIAKKTKTGKNYLILETVGPTGKPTKLSMWGWKGEKYYEPYTLCFAEVEKNDFGLSTTSWKLKEIG